MRRPRLPGRRARRAWAPPSPPPAGAAGRPWFGPYLGDGPQGPVFSGPESSALVLGPPRSGKTTSIVVPCVLDAPGACVSTSTKPDVLGATGPWRHMVGRCFVFDPTGSVAIPRDAVALRWSPVTGCQDFERAVATAHALASAARPLAHLSEAAHWVERAEALLAPLLFAAALSGAGMAALCRWVLSRDLQAAERIVGSAGHELAAAVLEGVAATDERERSGIFSTAAGVLAAYRSEAALQSASDPNFSPEAFASSTDTVYICAPGHAQAQLAPVVVALLDAIRQAVYARPAGAAPVVFALDEVANIAPLPSLPALAAEGGGQGLVTLACLQDLSQGRARWGEQAEGFFSLFSAKVLFPGIGDERTLSLVSSLAGERPVPMWTRTRGQNSSLSQSWTWRPVLPPSAVSSAPPGTALLVSGGSISQLAVRPWWGHPVWSSYAGRTVPVGTERLRPPNFFSPTSGREVLSSEPTVP